MQYLIPNGVDYSFENFNYETFLYNIGVQEMFIYYTYVTWRNYYY